MKISIAMFKDTAFNYTHVVSSSSIPTDEVQITEWLDVELKPLPEAEIIINELDTINLRIEETRRESIEKLEVLEASRQELLALSNGN